MKNNGSTDIFTDKTESFTFNLRGNEAVWLLN